MSVALTVGWFEGPRGELAGLFALADDSAVAVDAYRDLGRVLVARDGEDVVGHAQLVDRGPDDVELTSMAVLESRQGEGIGRLLVGRAVRACSEDGASTLLVATAAADTGVLRFYQRLGFRMLRIERDAFTPERGYPEVDVEGVPLRDRVWLSLDLRGRGPGA